MAATFHVQSPYSIQLDHSRNCLTTP